MLLAEYQYTQGVPRKSQVRVKQQRRINCQLPKFVSKRHECHLRGLTWCCRVTAFSRLGMGLANQISPLANFGGTQKKPPQ